MNSKALAMTGHRASLFALELAIMAKAWASDGSETIVRRFYTVKPTYWRLKPETDRSREEKAENGTLMGTDWR
jgi:myo-inositol catabolism protein IolC